MDKIRIDLVINDERHKEIERMFCCPATFSTVLLKAAIADLTAERKAARQRAIATQTCWKRYRQEVLVYIDQLQTAIDGRE